MSCEDCERIEKLNKQNKSLAYLRVEKSNILICACDTHFSILRDALANYQGIKLPPLKEVARFDMVVDGVSNLSKSDCLGCGENVNWIAEVSIYPQKNDPGIKDYTTRVCYGCFKKLHLKGEVKYRFEQNGRGLSE